MLAEYPESNNNAVSLLNIAASFFSVTSISSLLPESSLDPVDPFRRTGKDNHASAIDL
jgi:hypothetical protein